MTGLLNPKSSEIHCRCIKVYLFLAKMVSEWRGSLTQNGRKIRHIDCFFKILVVYLGPGIFRRVYRSFSFLQNQFFFGRGLKLSNWGVVLETKAVHLYRSARQTWLWKAFVRVIRPTLLRASSKNNNNRCARKSTRLTGIGPHARSWQPARNVSDEKKKGKPIPWDDSGGWNGDRLPSCEGNPRTNNPCYCTIHGAVASFWPTNKLRARQVFGASEKKKSFTHLCQGQQHVFTNFWGVPFWGSVHATVEVQRLFFGGVFFFFFF